MEKSTVSSAARASLDRRLAPLRPSTAYTPPPKGWIKAVRGALGMTTAQLADRLGVKQPTAVGLEQSEQRGSIELGTLRRVAEALDCTLVYALVPNRPLETTVRERARRFLKSRREAVEHTMLLEDQQVAGPGIEAQVDEVVRSTNPRLFWDE